MSILDPDANASLLQTLRGDVVMVGLNIASAARLLPEPFRNFHDPDPRANDFKIRYAFRNTPYYGAYMTDIIKGLPMISSGDLLQGLKTTPAVVRESIDIFREELADLGPGRPTILAFGADAHRLIEDNVSPKAYFRLIRITHYSYRIGKVEYRRTVLSQCARG
jgi:hypothetical protein